MCLFVFIMFKINHKDMTYVKSNIDNKYYLVRDVSDKQNASDTLATLRANMYQVNDYLYSNKYNKGFIEYKPYIEQLNDRIRNAIIIESSANSIYTSYSVNKGEQLVFCIRSVKRNNNLHDVNIMMYVVLHEISHIACPEVGHTDLFKKIFAFITKNAIDIGIYERIDFDNNPTEYCGIDITDSIV